jgi:hypothetical protein
LLLDHAQKLQPSSHGALDAMTLAERLDLFERDLYAVRDSPDGMLIFNVAGDEDSYLQFSQRAGEPLYCEVSNRSEGWNSHSLNSPQRNRLIALGYAIPSPHHQANPNKNYDGTAKDLATEVEEIFRQVFGMGEQFDVVSSGVLQ